MRNLSGWCRQERRASAKIEAAEAEATLIHYRHGARTSTAPSYKKRMSPLRHHAALSRASAARLRGRIRRPPAHWTLMAFLLLMVSLLLVVQGITTKTVGASATAVDSPASPLAGQQPVLADQAGKLAPIAYTEDKRIALSFDDGPDATWTPKVLAVLGRYHVPGTFFLVGSQVSRYPSLVRQEHATGSEVGNHTFTHAELAALPVWERKLQVQTTETAISGVIGVRPRLLRPPYSSTPAGLTPQEESALVPLARDGYLITLANYDTEDWSRPGVPTILQNLFNGLRDRHGRGGIVLMHDAGGNRSETVTALGQIIPRLQAQGYRFVTVSALAGLPAAATELPASGSDRLRGHLLLGGLLVSRVATTILNAAVIVVGILVFLRMLARRHVRRRQDRSDLKFTPPVSIVVPAYNEEVGIARAVGSLAASEYPTPVEVVVVDDGSTDQTGAVTEALDLPNVRVIHQANAGKPAALNRGIAAASNDIIVTVDGDTVFESDTVLRLVQGFADPRVGAVSGNTKVGNRKGLLGRWQHIEYVMGFNLDRRMYEVLNCMPTVPGAIGAFRRQAVAEIGGVSGATLAEDTDITMAVGRNGWRVVYVEDARAWTEAPETLGQLWRQRYRWAYGTIQSVWKHKGAMLHPSEGNIGRRALPYLLVFQIVLPVLAPVIDLFALYGVLFLNPLTVGAYWVGFNLFQLVLALYAFHLDGESKRPLWSMPLQQFVYRQLMYLVVIESLISALLGSRLRWGHLERTGNVEVAQ